MTYSESGAKGGENTPAREANLLGVIEEGKLRIAELAEEARAIADDHWNFHYRENALLLPKQKGRLVVFIRERKGGLEISWAWFRFIKKEGAIKSEVRNNHITKGRDHKYRPRSLARHCKDWEVDHVLEIESRLAEVRREYSHIRQMMTSAKLALKASAKRPRVERKNKGKLEYEEDVA
jgi:hypothetical protein